MNKVSSPNFKPKGIINAKLIDIILSEPSCPSRKARVWIWNSLTVMWSRKRIWHSPIIVSLDDVALKCDTVQLQSAEPWWCGTEMWHSPITVSQALMMWHWNVTQSNCSQPSLDDVSLKCDTVQLVSAKPWWCVTEMWYSPISVSQALMMWHWNVTQSN